LNATEQPIDTGTAAGKCFLDMLRVLAEFETNLRRERQLEGDRQGQGGQRLQGPAGFDRRHPGTRNEGALQRIAKALKIGRASVYRVLDTGAATSFAGAREHRPPGAFLRPHPS